MICINANSYVARYILHTIGGRSSVKNNLKGEGGSYAENKEKRTVFGKNANSDTIRCPG